MKRLCCLAVLLAGACAAQGQTPDPDKLGAYLSFQYGNGGIHGNASGDRSMGWRCGELRVGRDMDPALVGEDAITGESTARTAFVYYNEGPSLQQPPRRLRAAGDLHPPAKRQTDRGTVGRPVFEL